MFKSRIAKKLAAYIAVAVLVSVAAVGVLFGHFFREWVVKNRQDELVHRAAHVAAIMGDNMDRQMERSTDGSINLNGLLRAQRLISYVNIITADDVWVVDKKGNVEMRNHIPADGVPRRDMGVKGEVEKPPAGPRGRDLSPVFIGQSTIGDLPKNYRDVLKKALRGEAGFTESKDPNINETMVSAAAPVYSKDGGVEAAVMLRTPVFGLRRSFTSAFKILVACLLAALILGLILTKYISEKFTGPLNKMKDAAERLSGGDYTARSYVTQDDEVGELASTLDNMADRLEFADTETKKTDKLRKEFVANISHELRTPVTVLRGSLEALKDKVVTDPEEVDKYYDTMYKETLFQQRLISDLLELSRLQNADFPIEKEPVNLVEIINDAARSARQIARDKEITVSTDLDCDVYRLTGDYGRLKQMLMVFLDNAVKFSPEKSTIEIRLAGEELDITDHGVGIKKEDLHHVFDRFYKARKEGNKTGSGLGLAIAKEIAERHGIIPTMKSVVGEGSTVVLALPRKEAAEEAAEMTQG